MKCGMGVYETVEHMFLEGDMKEKCYLKLSVRLWNEMRAGVDHGMCCSPGLGKCER